VARPLAQKNVHCFGCAVFWSHEGRESSIPCRLEQTWCSPHAALASALQIATIFLHSAAPLTTVALRRAPHAPIPHNVHVGGLDGSGTESATADIDADRRGAVAALRRHVAVHAKHLQAHLAALADPQRATASPVQPPPARFVLECARIAYRCQMRTLNIIWPCGLFETQGRLHLPCEPTRSSLSLSLSLSKLMPRNLNSELKLTPFRDF
jgi:hypothetical protein